LNILRLAKKTFLFLSSDICSRNTSIFRRT
jgi:hypothetical protein